MKPIRSLLFALFLPLSVFAQDADTASQAVADDPVEYEPLVEDAPAPTPLVHTWFAIDPLTAVLGLAPNLQIERMVGGSFSVAGSGFWSVTGVDRGWELSVRHHFQPALAGGFLGAFVRGFESEAAVELPENGNTREFTFRQEGVTAGLHGGSLKVYPSGFSIGWNAGLGWPWVYQSWVGATPTENENMIRNFALAGAVVEAGLWMGFAY
ncbi:MAG: hypothetical protein IPN71_05760 [Fibrobacteres bacterium]|jgi:hypothetical protein|nr:hypothetical protein [Fibrobacterota bacterium]